MVGSHRFRCQDLNESGLRSYFREKAPQFEVFDAGVTFEEANIADELARELLAREPDLRGLYVAGGGVRGVMKALSEVKAKRRIVTIANDLTEALRAGLTNGLMTMVISHPLEAMAQTAVDAMAEAILRPEAPLPTCILPFTIHTSENV
jgi:LacI family transcriptional regulator